VHTDTPGGKPAYQKIKGDPRKAVPRTPAKRKVDEHEQAPIPKHPTIQPVSSARKSYALKDVGVDGNRVSLPSSTGRKVIIPLTTFKKAYEQKEGIRTPSLESPEAVIREPEGMQPSTLSGATASSSDTQQPMDEASGLSGTFPCTPADCNTSSLMILSMTATPIRTRLYEVKPTH